MKEWFNRFALVVVGMLIVLGLVLLRGDQDLQPTPPSQIAFTRCESGDTVWISSELILGAKIDKEDSCYRIQKIYECYEFVKESPFELLEGGGK